MSDSAPAAGPSTVVAVTPYLYYDDAGAALDWLGRVFGFTDPVRYVDDDGTVHEAEISAGASRIMMAGRGPKDGEGAGQLLIVHVDDVDAHHAHTTAEGITAEPPQDKPYGPRTYDVTDPWGYRWTFWQQVRPYDEATGGLRKIRG